MDYRGRQQRLLRALATKRLDALLVKHAANVRYLCGFTGSSGTLLVCKPQPVFFTDGRYTAQAEAEVEGARVVISRSPRTKAEKAVGRLAPLTLGIESDHITVTQHEALRKALPRTVRLRPVSGIVERLRMVKEEDEIRHIRVAALTASALFDAALEAIRPGMSEIEVAAELEYEARRAGAEAMSFETIVAAGLRSALPHGKASEHLIPQCGFVVLDFGVILGGYCSDMTRTVHVGRPGLEARRMYQAVREAQQAALDAVCANVGVGRVDMAARSRLTRAGLGRYFNHSTGHGVGLEIHEMPRLARGVDEKLASGMVITIEPGAYVVGRGGVRIEDMVAVTETGCEVLTPAPKELITI